jgi:hypothetical protein
LAVALELGEEVAEIVVFHDCLFRRPCPILANPLRRDARGMPPATWASCAGAAGFFVRNKG